MSTQIERSYLLSDLIGLPAVVGGRKVGKLADLIVTEQGKIPEVTHALVKRPFGHKSLLVPWAKVTELTPRLLIDAATTAEVKGEPADGQVCLKDHLLDKKVLDCDDDEVEVVYDIKLALRQGRLYATDVDCSRAAFLRRIGLRPLADLLRSIASRINDDTIPWTYVQRLPEDISGFHGDVKLTVLKEKLPEIHPVDLADILEELDPDERLAIFNELETEHASDTLEEIEPRVQRELISSLDTGRAAELINDMSPAQAADILAVLPAPDVDDILELIDTEEARKIHHLLEHHDDTIVHFATTHVITFPPETTIRQVLDDYRIVAKGADVVMYVYVLDETRRLIGVVDIKEIMQAEPADRLADVMTTNLVTLNTGATVKEAAKLFARYSFRAIPIVDDAELMMGAIPYRDVMDLQHRS
jgi:CBS domain-containing protein/sporulation protein YlmC with PRC-barrel domain